MTIPEEIALILPNFKFTGTPVCAKSYGTGHINDTYRVTFEEGSKSHRYILQRINPNIFKDPVAVMQNIERVTTHLATKLLKWPASDRRVLSLIPSHQIQLWHLDADHNCWRAYRFIERASTFDSVKTTEQAYQAAHAFGTFQASLVDLPGPPLHTTIPDFHNTPKRFSSFLQALQKNEVDRRTSAEAEIDFALKRESLSSILLDANLLQRVTHNDTKIGNVMLDDASGEGICVIDLDTVMPGLALYDFGDMVRTMTSPALEDEVDLCKVTMQFPMFEAVLRGYLATASVFLTPPEKQHLVPSTKLIAFEQGLRFLTDYLAGDKYYKVHRPNHNLDRCRTQFELLKSIESQEEKMIKLVDSLESEPAFDLKRGSL